MKQMTLITIVAIFLLTAVCLAVPSAINFQGNVTSGGTAFDGTGEFKFAIVDDPNTPLVSYWSHDGTSVAGSEPSGSLNVEVASGLYHVILGPDPQEPLNAAVFANDPVYLRIWFNDGVNGFQQLGPDQQIVSTGYTLHALQAENAEDADTVDGMEGSALEESAEIDADIAVHAGNASVHHMKTTSFTELSDTATDAQIQNNISINNGNLYALANVGFIGIGTESPVYKLDVHGDLRCTDGIRMDSSYFDGVSVGTAGVPSTSLSSSDKNGIEIAGAQGHGFYVGRADLDGLHANDTGGYGVYVGTTANDGIRVENAGDEGVQIQSAAQDGIYIVSTGRYGIFVQGATTNGAHLITTDASNEWGVYTPDKIYASNHTTKTISTHVRNMGARFLEPGDIVSIAGGFDENILGEDDAAIIHIRKSDHSNAEGILGVVEYRVAVHEEVVAQEDGASAVDRSFRFAAGPIRPGDYLSVIVFGPTDVKCGPDQEINVGEGLTVDDAGRIRSLRKTEVNGIMIAENVGILGKAVEDANGSGTIKVFVNCL